MIHTFTIEAEWQGNLGGKGTLFTSELRCGFSAPKAFGGSGIGTNPEALLVGAAGSCLLITLGAMLAPYGDDIRGIRLRSVAEVELARGLTVRTIRHCPTIIMAGSAAMKTIERVRETVLRAESYCLVSKAMRGNVAVEVVPAFIRENPVESPQGISGEVSGERAKGALT